MAVKNYLDKTGLALVWEKIKNALSNKVDKVDGKGLSSNDYTSEEKTKLSGIATGAQVNVLEGIQVNGTSISAVNKIANINVPTKYSDLSNDNNTVTDSSYVHTDNNYTTAEKSKLEAIASGAEVNQNAFSNVKVGSTTVSADAKTDTLTLAAGGIVTLTPDATNDKVTITVPSTLSSFNNDTNFTTLSGVSSMISNKADKATTLSGYGITNAYTKTETQNYVTGLGYQTASDVSAAISTAVAAVLKYKGTKATVSALPSTGNQTGDVWHVTETEGEYAWNGSSWDELGSFVDLSPYVLASELVPITSSEISTICV